MHNKNSSRLLD